MGARRRARAAGVPGGCLWPEMRFVYDAPARVKHECRSCFAVNAVNGEPSVTNCGEYYKNVRSEWASLVTTPPTARFQDALPFVYPQVPGVRGPPSVVQSASLSHGSIPCQLPWIRRGLVALPAGHIDCHCQHPSHYGCAPVVTVPRPAKCGV